MTDFLVERTHDAQVAPIGALQRVGRANPFAVIGFHGEEQMIPLEISPIIVNGLKRKYPQMFLDVAKLLDVRPEGLSTTVTMANRCADSPLSPNRWLNTIIHRLRSLQPSYCIFVATGIVLHRAEIGIDFEELLTLARAGRASLPSVGDDLLIVAGLNAARTIAILTPFLRTARGVVTGPPKIMDSVGGERWPGGLIAKIYEPGKS
ncbi:hypothetical protein ACFL2T_00225 [Elusimicrobiota bacterium]